VGREVFTEFGINVFLPDMASFTGLPGKNFPVDEGQGVGNRAFSTDEQCKMGLCEDIFASRKPELPTALKCRRLSLDGNDAESESSVIRRCCYEKADSDGVYFGVIGFASYDLRMRDSRQRAGNPISHGSNISLPGRGHDRKPHGADISLSERRCDREPFGPAGGNG